MGVIIDNWVSNNQPNIAASPRDDYPNTDCNAIILIQPTTSITLNVVAIAFGC